MPTRYDIIIIGTGPGGVTLAYKLAPSGRGFYALQVEKGLRWGEGKLMRLVSDDHSWRVGRNFVHR